MFISVLNIKINWEWHKAIKLNYKNTRNHVIVVLRVPSTIHDTCLPNAYVRWLTAHSGISLLHKCIWLRIINGMYSNKLGNSFRRKTSYAFPVKLLSKTLGPINLLPSTPYHTFTVNLLWKLVTLLSCGLSWDHVCIFRKLFTLSRVNDASSLNKMTLNSSGWAYIQWHKSMRWTWSPGSRCCTLWSW